MGIKRQNWFEEAINLMPDEDILKCFRAALKKNEQYFGAFKKVSILKKRWRDINVNILFALEDIKFSRRMKTLVDERSGKMENSEKEGDEDWIVSGDLYYYINHAMCGEFYDSQEFIGKEVFIKEKKIWQIAEKYSQDHDWKEEELQHFYTALLAAVAIRCKFIAMLDFDYCDTSGWIRWNIMCSPYSCRYDRLKAESLAAGWAMYILSRVMPPINIFNVFEAIGKEKIEWEIGFCYLMTPGALKEAISSYANVCRYFDATKTITELYGNDVTETVNQFETPLKKWEKIVESHKGKVMEEMEKLLALDREIEKATMFVENNKVKTKDISVH